MSRFYPKLRSLAVLHVVAALSCPLAAMGEALFEDVAKQVGIDFVHFNGMSGEFYFPEMTGQGGALLDFDNDGDLDLFAVQGAVIGPGKSMKDVFFPPDGSQAPSDRLFRNDTDPQKGPASLRFTDVTVASGLSKIATGYGMGVTTGDFDNDGWIDLYVTNYGSNQLLRNRGDGTFEDVTRKAGVDDPAWSTSATFFDLDRDGRLDLFLTNYVVFDLGRNPKCFATSSRRDYCGPSAFDGVADRLWRNRGDGTFEDITTKAGIGAEKGAGLGVVAADFDEDGWLDLYVANDGEPNHLWLNQRNGAFRDEALLGGVAVNREGNPEASMGVLATDFDGDGDADLFMTHLMGETNTLYINEGAGLFEDRTLETGLSAGSLPFTSFGTAWLDVENNGRNDLMIANGAVRILEEQARDGDRFPLAQPNQLFLNRGGRFVDATAQGGDAFKSSAVSRGTAVGDLDNDGDADLVVFDNNGPLQLLRNRVGQQSAWLGLRLVGTPGKRDMLGARAEIELDSGAVLWGSVATDGSYCSANDPRVLFGLGKGGKVSQVRVHWPDGKQETWPSLEVGSYTTLQQGTGSKSGKPGAAE
ncbi:MAG: CRTAC1 family protein [Acidobacteriota bacterium]